MSNRNKKLVKQSASKSSIHKRKKKKNSLQEKSQKAGIIATYIAVVSLIVTFILGIIDIIINREPETEADDMRSIAYKDEFQSLDEKTADLSYFNSLYSQGQEFLNQADFETAAEYFEKALEGHEDTHYAKRDTARIHYALGIAYRYLYRFQDAADQCTLALGILNGILESEEVSEEEEGLLQYEIGYVYYLRGNIYLNADDYDRAMSDCHNCEGLVLIIEENSGWDEWYSVAAVKNFHGKICFAIAYEKESPFLSDQDTDHNTYDYNFTFKDAFEWYNSALEEKHRERDAETAAILLNRAGVEIQWGQYDEAITDLEEALFIYQSLPGRQQYNMGDVYFDLAIANLYQKIFEGEDVLSDQRTLDEFCGRMNQALIYTEKWYGEQHPKTAIAYENLAFSLFVKGEFDAAREHFEKAKEIFSRLGMEEDVKKEERFLNYTNQALEERGEEGHLKLEIELKVGNT